MRIVSLTPIKLNNERTPGKNTRCFDDGTPLIEFIQRTLLKCTDIERRFVYCSNEQIKPYLLDGVEFLKRDSRFDTADCDVNEMFRVFAEEVDADIYVLAHATAPFISPSSIERGIEAIVSGGYDSAVAVKRQQEFVWIGNKPFNYDTIHIPRTQDLPPMHVETTGLYIYTKDVIMNRRSRIGDNPFMLEVSEIEALDINTPADFDIADAVNSLIRRKNVL